MSQFEVVSQPMRADELDHKELLELDPEGGAIRFAGRRALLLDAVAMGLLRKSLVENFGITAARTVLTQCGFAHGWRMAEAMHAEFTWDSAEDWRRAGTRIHALEGLFRVESGSNGPLSKEGLTLVSSYEAEQHLLHLGRSEVPMGWTICSLTSGYLSRSYGRETYVLEDRCMGKGDAACHLLKVVELHVSPLRERRDDILPLARVLLADAALRMRRKISGLAPGAADLLLRYEWPGNVRELENAMERAVALARGTRVEIEDLPEETPPGGSQARGQKGDGATP